MSDEKIGRASISVDETGRGRVVVGMQDITSQVGAGVIDFRAGRPTVIKVEVPLASAVARGDIELDEETAKALEALGWSGPNTELLRRRDLQDALGGLGVVLREWPDLVEWVRVLAEHNTELHAQTDSVLHKVATSLGDYAPREVKWSTVLEAIGELAARMEGLDK